MNQKSNLPSYIYSEAFLSRLMKRQLRLSLSCGIAFAVILFALPLLNYFLPELMATRVAGFTFTWLVLGILFFPFVWIISFVFIRKSLAMEANALVISEANPEL